VIYVHEFGPADGRPLLALHGLSGHGARWRRLAADQLPGFRVIAPDLRGHGLSTWNPPWHLETYAQDILATLDDVGVDQIPVMGHSFGGAIAVHLARLAPSRVTRLVLVDPAIGLDPEAALQDAEAARVDEVFTSLDSARAAQANRWPFATDEQLDAEIEAGVIHHEDGVWRRRYSQAMAVTAWSEMSRPHVVPPASIPTLLIPALRADFVTPEFVADCETELGANLSVREVDSGHVIYLERPDELGKLVTAFLG
jgi:lipase